MTVEVAADPEGSVSLRAVAPMEPEEDLDDLLILKETRGFDFTGYKPSTVHRRVRRRMTLLNIGAFSEYRDYLGLQPDEFGLLFDSMLINVTSFFRDPLAWQARRERVIPELLSAKNAKAPIRAWSAGCATGEEAYTLAIVLAEARLRDNYFELSGTKHAFRRDLRRQVIFGRNDLTRDAPISRVNLLTARNTLMYFNAETQANVIRRFHFALSHPGYLFLGKAEMLLNHADRFVPVDLRKRLFRKASQRCLSPPTLPRGLT